jgi:hypothetical protein
MAGAAHRAKRQLRYTSQLLAALEPPSTSLSTRCLRVCVCVPLDLVRAAAGPAEPTPSSSRPCWRLRLCRGRLNPIPSSNRFSKTGSCVIKASDAVEHV